MHRKIYFKFMVTNARLRTQDSTSKSSLDKLKNTLESGKIKIVLQRRERSWSEEMLNFHGEKSMSEREIGCRNYG